MGLVHVSSAVSASHLNSSSEFWIAADNVLMNQSDNVKVHKVPKATVLMFYL